MSLFFLARGANPQYAREMEVSAALVIKDSGLQNPNYSSMMQ